MLHISACAPLLIENFFFKITIKLLQLIIIMDLYFPF